MSFFPTVDSDPFALAGIVDPESDHETTVPEDRGHLNPCHNNNCESCRLGTLIGNTEKGQWDEMFDEAPTSYQQRCAKTQSRIKRGKVDGNSSEEK